MSKFKSIIFLIVMVVFGDSYSQSGNYYVSGLDLPKSQAPIKDMENNFIYRISNGNNRSFYLVKINDLMLKEKSIYRWPVMLNDDLKATSFLSKDSKGKSEILDFIFNEKLILTESQNAFVKIKNTFQKLEKVDYVGVVLVGNEKQYFYVPKPNGEHELKKGPLFQYVIDNSKNYILAAEKGKIPKWILPAAKPRQYLVLSPTLNEIPNLPELQKVPEYNATMDEVKEAYVNQKNRDSEWINSSLPKLIEFPGKSDDETLIRFESREKIQKEAFQNLMNEILTEGWEQRRYALYEQRLEVQKVVQEKSRIIDDLSKDKRSLLIEQWWENRLNLRSRTLIAGHLEHSVVEEAPSQLWGQDLFFDFTKQLFSSDLIYWNVALGGGYTTWKVKESAKDASYQYWYGFKLGLLCPIFIGVNNGVNPYSGGGLSMRLGSVSRNSETQVNGDTSRSFQKLATGFYSGLDFNFGESGLGFGVEYEYLSDEFGEIAINLHLPLASWRN